MSEKEAVMQAFVVYNAETGEIAHIHVEATLEGEPRRLERHELVESFVAPRADEKVDPAQFEVLEVAYDELELRKSGDADLYVDVQRRELAGRVRRPSDGTRAPELSGELAHRESLARQFANREELVRAFLDAARDSAVWDRAEREPAEYLRTRGIEVPEGLAVEFLTDPTGRPAPDYEFFTIRFFNCRTYWIKKPGGAEKVEICRGFQIVPHPLPPIA